MIDHIQRQAHIGLLARILGNQLEPLRGIAGEGALAGGDCTGRHIEAEVALVTRKLELIAVAAAELDDHLDAVSLDEVIDHLGLESGQPVIRSGARIPAACVSRFPVALDACKLSGDERTP
jgi:hypothetical protein